MNEFFCSKKNLKYFLIFLAVFVSLNTLFSVFSSYFYLNVMHVEVFGERLVLPPGSVVNNEKSETKIRTPNGSTFILSEYKHVPGKFFGWLDRNGFVFQKECSLSVARGELSESGISILVMHNKKQLLFISSGSPDEGKITLDQICDSTIKNRISRLGWFF